MPYKESNSSKQTCSFCQRSRKDVAKLVVSQDVSICNICIDMVHDLLHKDDAEVERPSRKKSMAVPSPRAIKELLDSRVIGQEQAKIALSVAVHNHYKRLNNKKAKVRVDKSNVLILGPTGTGKTLMARTIAELLDVPFVIGDATTLTQTGYVGDDAETLLSRLLMAADYDVDRAQQGIVFIDEMDKISAKTEAAGNSRDISGEGVQQALLKMLEGSEVQVTIDGNKKTLGTDTVLIDTTNILFVCSGAFVGLEKVMARQRGASIGFNNKVDKAVAKFDQVRPQDIIKYGLIPELVGRLPVLTYTTPLSKEDLIAVLTEPEHNLISQYQQLFEPVKLVFSQDALEALAERAMKDNTGARGLRGQLDRVLTPLQFKLTDENLVGVSSVLVNKEVIEGSGEPLYTFKKVTAAKTKNEQKA